MEAMETFNMLKDDFTGFEKSTEPGVWLKNYQTKTSQKFHITVFNIEFTMRGTIEEYQSMYSDPIKLK
jgi:hypothetical protein